MDKKAEFSMKALIFSFLLVGLLFAAVGTMMFSFSQDADYDTAGYDKSDLLTYSDFGTNITKMVNETYKRVDETTIDSNWFDFLSGAWNFLISPFKFIYRAVVTSVNLIGDVVGRLHLISDFGGFLVTVLMLFILFWVLKNYGIIKND